MKELLRDDLSWCVRRLPKAVVSTLKENPLVCVAGGFIRSCIAHETINDVDLFAPSPEDAEKVAKLVRGEHDRMVKTDNAYTVVSRPHPVQIIHRWCFASPSEVVPSFDFTIARAAIWYEGKAWRSLCDDRFYPDLAAKRLVYTSPVRNEDAGGSLLRVLKFYQRGYRIPLDSLGAAIARLVVAVRKENINVSDESEWAKILTGLLREVDPNVDPTHEAHLPHTQTEEPA